MNNNVKELRPGSQSLGGDGGGENGGRLRAIESRLTHIETKLEIELKHLATKADVETIRTWALKGALFGMIAVASVVIAALKLFGA